VLFEDEIVGRAAEMTVAIVLESEVKVEVMNTAEAVESTVEVCNSIVVVEVELSIEEVEVSSSSVVVVLVEEEDEGAGRVVVVVEEEEEEVVRDRVTVSSAGVVVETGGFVVVLGAPCDCSGAEEVDEDAAGDVEDEEGDGSTEPEKESISKGPTDV